MNRDFHQPSAVRSLELFGQSTEMLLKGPRPTRPRAFRFENISRARARCLSHSEQQKEMNRHKTNREEDVNMYALPIEHCA